MYFENIFTENATSNQSIRRHLCAASDHGFPDHSTHKRKKSPAQVNLANWKNKIPCKNRQYVGLSLIEPLSWLKSVYLCMTIVHLHFILRWFTQQATKVEFNNVSDFQADLRFWSLMGNSGRKSATFRLSSFLIVAWVPRSSGFTNSKREIESQKYSFYEKDSNNIIM